MLKRPHYIALAIVFLLVLILFKLPGTTAARLKLAFGSFFLPLFGLSVSTQQLADKAGTAVLPRSELERQNQDLRRQNDELKIREQQNEQIWRENERLREFVGWQRQSRWKFKPARVIGRDPANWWRTLQIDLGSRNDIQPNMPVLTRDGLIGRIASVGGTRAQVLLLGDPNLRVAAVIKETGETGVILANASHPLENNMVDLGYLAGRSSIQAGQTVWTSGDGGIFPKGILIGNVVDWRSVESGLATEARVRLSAKMNSLEDVLVLFTENSEAKTPAPAPIKK